MLVKYKVQYSPRGPGHVVAFETSFDHLPTPQEIAKAFGVTEGPHYERIIDGSFTIDKRAT